MSFSSAVRVVLAPAIFVFLAGQYIAWRRRIASLPPGPPKLPLIENILNMPQGFDWVKFHELAEKYNSDVIHFSALGYSIIVLDSYQAAKEMLDSRSGIYSSRMVSVMMTELAGMGKFFSLMPYGDRWRASRRMFMQHLGPENAKVNRPREVFYTRRCLSQLLKTPANFHRHLQHLVGSISLSITYGLKPRVENDEYVALAEKYVQVAVDIIAGGITVVDILPFLKYIPTWFPGAKFKRDGEACAKLTDSATEDMYRLATESMNTPDYTPSLMSEILEKVDQKDPNFDRALVRDVGSTIYGAAADTTWSSLIVFILAMTCYPEVQARVQTELDAHLSGKLPDHADVEDLPYLTAVFMEVLRWKPVLPIGIPHATSAKDVYNGYVIPEGSVIIANQWAMLQDHIAYPEPSEFRPERFLKDGKIDETVRSPIDIAFGFGRRICPGRHVAQSTFMVAAASILSTFDILMKKDKNGVPIRPDPKYHFSAVSRPENFPCEFVPRSTESCQLINDWMAAEGDSPP